MSAEQKDDMILEYTAPERLSHFLLCTILDKLTPRLSRTGVSQHYLTDVLKLKMCKEKDKKHIDKEFSDFQGKTFKPSGIVELIIISDEFEGVNCRKLWFLVSRLSTFKILLGKKTIRREGLLVRSARAPFLGDAAHVGLQDKTSKSKLC